MKQRHARWSGLIALFFVLSLSAAPLANAQEASPVASPEASPSDLAAQHGLQIADMDLSVEPGDDFYRFANGGWLDHNEIPADRPSYGVFDALDQQVRATLLEIVQQVDPKAGDDADLVAGLYAQATNVDQRAENGVKPLDPMLANIDGIATMDDALNYNSIAAQDGVSGLFSIYGAPGLADSSANIAWVGGPTLLLPSSDYYLDDSDDMKSVRDAWLDTTTALLQYLGYSESDARAAAEKALAIETAIAGVMTPEADRSDPNTYNNPRTVAELTAAVPGLDWQAWLTAMGLTTEPTIYVDDAKYLEALSGLLADYTVDDLKSYYKTQLIWAAAPYLSEEVGATWFAFQGPVLSGQAQRAPLEQRGLTAVQNSFPDALSQLYVAQAFPPEAKAAIEELVHNLIAAFKIRIENSTWMSDATKAKAVEKLEAMTIKVGYPDKWDSYTGVEIGDSFWQSMRNAANDALTKNWADIGKPVDRTEWSMAPFEVNAYYNPSFNEIVFPAAILQAPFFDPEADPAANYGGIGYVIGHEITHGFDLSGSQFDKDGNLNSWWTDEDRAAFQALNDKVVEQYNGLEVLPGSNVDGALTVTENVADLGGLQTAYDALQVALAAQSDEEQANLPWFLSQNQRFFLAAATTWREKASPEYIQYLLSADEHSPASVRAVQPARNMAAFYTAFGIKPGDPEYLAPDDRILIW